MVVPPDYATGLSIPFFGRDKKPSSETLNGIDHHPNQDVQLPVSAPNHIENNIPLLATVAAPMIGPEDAPHLRYAPSYFSTQLPETETTLPNSHLYISQRTAEAVRIAMVQATRWNSWCMVFSAYYSKDAWVV
jgi:hypothetical protein